MGLAVLPRLEQGKGEMASRSDDKLDEIAARLDALTNKNGNGKSWMLNFLPVLIAVGGVLGVSYMPRESAAIQSKVDQQQIRIDRLEKEREQLDRLIEVNRRVEDERYRDLEIKLAAKRIITPGTGR